MPILPLARNLQPKVSTHKTLIAQIAEQQASDIEAIAGQHAEDGCLFEKVLRTRMAFRLIGGYAEA